MKAGGIAKREDGIPGGLQSGMGDDTQHDCMLRAQSRVADITWTAVAHDMTELPCYPR